MLLQVHEPGGAFRAEAEAEGLLRLWGGALLRAGLPVRGLAGAPRGMQSPAQQRSIARSGARTQEGCKSHEWPWMHALLGLHHG